MHGMIKSAVSVMFCVRDLDTACAFYEQKLGLKRVYLSTKTGWAEFDLGGIRLALARRAPYGGGNNPVLNVHAANLPRTIATLHERGVEFPEGTTIHSDFFGHWIACRDPDGNVIHLFEPNAS